MITLDGQRVEVPGVETKDWVDAPKEVFQATHGSPRRSAIRGSVAHTVSGIRSPKLVLGPGKPSTAAEWYSRYQAKSSRAVSWDYTIDRDGTVAWSNDPFKRATWHGHTVNGYTLGFEMLQDEDGTMYEATIEAAAKMVLFLIRYDHPLMAVQAQTPWKDGAPQAGMLWRCGPDYDSMCGRNLNGIYGHRNVFVWKKHNGVNVLDAHGKPIPDSVRGFGDPNNYLFERLHALGFEGFDCNAVVAGHDAALPFGQEQDRTVWAERQRTVLGFDPKDCDGVPGPKTRTALRAKGYKDGLWATLTA